MKTESIKVMCAADVPKSRQRKFSPSGTCFSFSWEQIAGIVQEWRIEHGYADENEPVKMVWTADKEVVFYTNPL
jgi:hypothetical protein